MTPANGEKVYAGTKTQTRRKVKLKHLVEIQAKDCEHYAGVRPDGAIQHCLNDVGLAGLLPLCPYGTIGSRLYIKEACWIWGIWVHVEDRWCFHEHHSQQVKFGTVDAQLVGRRGDIEPGWIRRSGLFMPRWAARSIVELTEIRVQRLNEISEDDAKAEGCTHPNARQKFGLLIDSIHGPGTWSKNEFYWALTFRRVGK